MKASKIVGKTISGVSQYRERASSGGVEHYVAVIFCTDGTVIRPVACELESGDGYGIDLVITNPKRVRKAVKS